MKSLINIQKKLVPELLEVIKQRYTLLHNVDLYQPIGRRALAETAKLTERHVRGEIDFLQEQGLIQVTTRGMYITNEGKLILEQLADFIGEISGLHVLEQRIKETLHVDNVIIVPGNSDEDEWVKQDMGKACVRYLKTILKPKNTIAVTGGSTMAVVAKVMTPLNDESEILFVPARGGIGEKVENQASGIVAEMARKAHGEYRMLYVPDPISDSTYETIITEPAITEILEQIKSSNIVIHGVGDALRMAGRRRTSERVITLLKEKNAASEAFGYYFDHSGDVVHKVKTVGIQLEDLEAVDHVITVAGGTSKGEAIASYYKQGKSDLLITDQGAAERILRG
ncbi:sugar-binding transcriptional regulator [Oceanobacillus massiliensis]|uniref:sugar-binding transcriptional regulator n=1 Tax=Oceanobacillus massiliensis TaxID=1465765 RepID=UPI0002889545|nr:sugar-binding domain-containing protein [Oceanobacillus massiliensis]